MTSTDDRHQRHPRPHASIASPHRDPDRDPVCWMHVTGSLQVDHAGERYRFCSTCCREKCLAESEKYLTAAAADIPVAAHAEHADAEQAHVEQAHVEHAHVEHAHEEHAHPRHAEANAPVGTRYTYPMHPEIVGAPPGGPIFGMALEPMLPSLDDDDSPELRDVSRSCWFTDCATFSVTPCKAVTHG